MAFAWDNPIAWVHFRLRGGWKNIITTSCGYAVIICGLIMLSLRADATGLANVMHLWTNGLLGLQLAIVILFATSAIRNSVRRDLSTRMIESHRLMPVPATQAVAGLIVGSAFQFLCLGAITFLIGIATCTGATLSLRDWMLANAIVWIFGVCLWFAASLFAYLSTAIFGLLGMVVFGSMMSSGTVLAMLPGLTVLAGPMIGHSVFGIMGRGVQWDWAYQVSTAAQLCAAGLCFLGAVRKYRREDQVAFTPVMGLVLVAGWALLCLFGIRYSDSFDPRMLRGMQGELPLRMMGSMVSTALLALVPVSSAAWLEMEWGQRRQLSDPSLRGRPMPVNAVILIAVLIFMALPVEWHNLTDTSAHLREAALSAACSLLAISYLLRILYRVTTRTLLPMLILIFVTWVLPLVLEGARYTAIGDMREDFMTWIGTCSPLGTFYVITQNEPVVLWPGLIGQAVPALLMAMLYHATRRKRNVSPVAAA